MNFWNFATTIVIGSLIVSFITFVWNYITGRMKPLKPKDAGEDDTSRSQFLPLNSEVSEIELIMSNRSSVCPLHSKPYIGISRFWIVLPKHFINMFRLNERLDGVLHIALCEECVDEALALKTKRFKWTRRNYREHPKWASSHIVPHLLGSKFAYIESVKVKTSEDDTLHECLIPEAVKAAREGQPQYGLSPKQVVEKYRPFLTDKHITIGDKINERHLSGWMMNDINDLLSKTRDQVGAFDNEIYLLVYHFHSCPLLITDKCVYSKDRLTNKEFALPLTNIQVVDKSELNVFYDNWITPAMEFIIINDKRIGSFDHKPKGRNDLADFLVLLLRDLAKSAQNRTEKE